MAQEEEATPATLEVEAEAVDVAGHGTLAETGRVIGILTSGTGPGTATTSGTGEITPTEMTGAGRGIGTVIGATRGTHEIPSVAGDHPPAGAGRRRP